MRTLFILAVALMSADVFATPTVSQVAAKQRWPWSTKVDIDYWLDSDSPADVSFTATWDGQSTPFALTGAALSGCTLSARPGMNHAEWDPVAAGFDAKTPLKNFVLTPTVVSSDSKRYFVIDLQTGDCSFHADEPNGESWNQEKYKTTHMAFRRVPAGVYTLGYSTEQINRLNALGASYKTENAPVFAERTVRITSDYYIGLFQVTIRQNNLIGGSNSGSTNPSVPHVNNWRGSLTDASSHANWPVDGFSVDPSSRIGLLRALVSGKMPSQMIVDLPTEAQWEVAARAGSTTFYSDFGTLDSTKQEILDYQIAHATNRTVSVGLMLPNAWGLYDTTGIAYEMTLNRCHSTATTYYDGYAEYKVPGQNVDPVGKTISADADAWALSCNCGWSSRGISYASFPPARRAFRASSSDGTSGARLCIHLNPPF